MYLLEHIILLNSIKKIFKVNIITQLIGLIIAPLLTLNYSLEDLGLYAFIYSLSSFLGNLMCFRIENAFFSSSKIEIDKILSPIVFIAFLISLISIFLIYFLKLNINFIYAIFGGTLISLFNVFYSYNVRIGREKTYNKQKIFRVFLELLVVIISLILSLKIEFCVLMVLSTYAIFFFNKITLNFQLSNYIIFFKIKRNLIISDLTSALMFSYYVQAPSLFLSSIDLQFSGLYFIVYKFCLVPSLMIAQSMGTVFKQYAAVEFENRRTVNNTINNMKKFFIKYWYFFLIFFLGLLVFFYILNFIKYPGIYNVFLIMFFCTLFRFFHSSYSSLVYVLSMQKSYLVMNTFLFILSGLSIYLSNNNVIYYLLYYSFLSSLVYFLYAVYFFKKIQVKP